MSDSHQKSHLTTPIRRLKINSVILNSLIMVLACASLSGCAVKELYEGEQGEDISNIQLGMQRSEIEALLNSPLRCWEPEVEITYCIYEYDAGRPPRKADAMAMLFMDVVSVGTFEFFWMVDDRVETYARTTARIIISYDSEEVVLGIFDEFALLPPEGRSNQ